MTQPFVFPLSAQCVQISRGDNNKIMGIGWTERSFEQPQAFMQHWILKKGYKDEFETLLREGGEVLMQNHPSPPPDLSTWCHRFWETEHWGSQQAQYVLVQGRCVSLPWDSSVEHQEVTTGARRARPTSGKQQEYDKFAVFREIDAKVETPLGYVHAHPKDCSLADHVPLGAAAPSFPVVANMRRLTYMEHWICVVDVPVAGIALRRVQGVERDAFEADLLRAVEPACSSASKHVQCACSVFSDMPPLEAIL